MTWGFESLCHFGGMAKLVDALKEKHSLNFLYILGRLSN